MRAVCIDNDNKGWDWILTSGKIYEIEIIGSHLGSDNCQVVDDVGNKIWLFVSRFKPLSDIREEKLNQVL